MGAPNVLILDEPTNDFDVETLAALEDLLDGFAGTLLIVSHDRYFLERVCDDFVALLGDEQLRELPGGIDDYLERRRRIEDAANAVAVPTTAKSASALDRETQKAQARLERQIDKIKNREDALHLELAANATDFERVSVLGDELRSLEAQRDALEEEWLGLVD
jgi:ABC transport system ATP-binding/permease protein